MRGAELARWSPDTHFQAAAQAPWRSSNRRLSMANNEKDSARSKGSNFKGGDSDDAVQEELKREQDESKEAIGDVAKDRNLSGSSSWTTLPADESPKSGS
jgi:hypothetical protein